MKKVLALALVLVMAIGMMVPAHAKVEIDGVEPSFLLLQDYYDLDEIGPDWEGYIRVPFSAFDLSDDAEAALLTTKNPESVFKRLADTVAVRIRARVGGAIMTAEVDGVECTASKGLYNLADFQAAALDLSSGLGGITSTNTATLALFEAYVKTVWPGWNTNPPEITAYNKAIALYKAYLTYPADVDDWNLLILIEAPEIPWANINEIDFEFDVLMHIDGRSDNDWYWTFEGTIANEEIDVWKDYEFANAYDGHVIHAEEYVPKIAICGNYDDDVYAHVKMASGKRIFFVALMESDMSDEAVFDRYPSIEYAYKILQVGLNAYTGNFIELGAVDSDYYVYGKDASGGLKYLGRGGELLPLSGKYYISTQKLDLSSDEPVDEIPVDVPTVVDDYNPSTGI